MKKKFHFNLKSRHWIVIMTIVCVGLIVTSLSTDYFAAPIRSVVGYLITPFQNGINTVGTALSSATQGFRDTVELTAENEALEKQVEELTDGDITGEALKKSLSAGVAVSVGLAMLRVLTGISVLWLVVPGYAVALILSFFVPKMFTAIAFDSGGVASGPMTATFLLSLAVGACGAVGGNIVTDAFGVVAMVAMTPLITIQILGLAYRRKCARTVLTPASPAAVFDGWGDYDIIEL